MIICKDCGTRNVAGNEYCRKCSAGLYRAGRRAKRFAKNPLLHTFQLLAR